MVGLLVAALEKLLSAFRLLLDVTFGFIYERDKRLARDLPPITDAALLHSANELAAKIRTRELTSVHVVTAYINRIRDVNGVLNAVVDNRFDEALKDARRADDLVENASEEELERLVVDKPFLGVPFTTKDCFAVRGLSHTCGLVKRANEKAGYDADAVARMRTAGAIPVAVTNVPQLCTWIETSNNVYGRTKNPYHPGRSSGGSSGGEGSIIGAAGSVIGIGSDTAGSIRIPAAFNGIFGHKPSTGIVSNRGQLPLVGGMIDGFLTTGPMCRYASDLIPMLKVLAKPNNISELNLDQHVDVRKLKVYFVPEARVTREVRTAQRKLIDALEREHGIETRAVSGIDEFQHSFMMFFVQLGDDPDQPPFSTLMADGDGSFWAYWELAKWFLLAGNTSHTLPSICLAILDRATVGRGKFVRRFFNRKFDSLKSKLDDLLGQDGVLVYPTHPTPAPYHHVSLFRCSSLAYTGIFNVLGYPVTQVPLGLTEHGLPVGVQLVSGINMDRNSIALACAVEKLFGGWVSPSRINA